MQLRKLCALAAVPLLALAAGAAEPPAWDDTRPTGWSAAFEKVAIPPAVAGGAVQRAMWHPAPGPVPRPLIVSLHTWSGDFAQNDPLAEIAIARGFNYLHPDFRGPNNRPEACGSDLVVADLDAAIDFALARGKVDRANIHVIGASGGGHATMLAWMRSRHDVRSFSAWVGISDLEKWHHESVARGARYATDLCRVTTGDPARFDPAEARKRSPLFMATPVARRQQSRLLLHAGVHDGYTGSVPITQTIEFYNRVVRDLAPSAQDALVPATITDALARQRTLPVGEGQAAPSRKHGETIYERRFQNQVRLEIFEGAHEMLVGRALDHVPAQASPKAEPTLLLRDDWRIQSSAQVRVTGEALSRPGCDTTGWVGTTVPNTVLGALVNHGAYGDPFVGRNLEGIPAADFKVSWWYRTEFKVEAVPGLEHALLCFDGINYRANVWLNGSKIADRAQLVGAFRRFELDVSAVLQPGANALAIEVFPPQPGDYTIGFVDWNPPPPDRNLGLFRGVRLRRSGAVSLADPFVRTDVDLATLQQADLSVQADVANHSAQVQRGTLTGAIAAIRFEVPFELQPRERKTLRVSPAEVPALRLRNPRLWWPLHYGEPNLHQLALHTIVAGQPSDGQHVRFGIRTVGDYLTPEGHRGYTINGKKILIRGGGWVDDLFLREDPRQLEAQFDYVRAMNLNTVRLEGFWGASERLYDLADEKGILLMAGWSCQWEWPEYMGTKIVEHDTFGGPKTPADVELVSAYLRDHVRWLRNHPSLFVWVLGSDKLPWPEVEPRYRTDLAQLDSTRPLLLACKQLTSPISGPTAVKMAGPYQYVTPNYWFEDRKHGGAFGFNTETGPGPQIPPLASLRRMLPPDQLWPINESWNYHCGRFAFGDLKVYLDAFNARYGEAKSVEELAFKAQAANYEAMRAMFEAFGAARPQTTGVVQWMLNAPWPKLYWQLYSHDLMPNGAFYGAMKGSTPLHVVYNPTTRTLVAVNDTLADLTGASLKVQVFDLNSTVVFEKELRVSCAGNSAHRVLDLPALDAKVPVHFLSLKLRDAAGRPLSDNFYWISTKPDVLDYEKTTWVGTPLRAHADLTALNRLPKVDVAMTVHFAPGEAAVTLTNTSARIAFFNELHLQKVGTMAPVLPVFWSDNYVSLLPHESRTLKARFRPADAGGEKLAVALQGWNLNATSGGRN